jgi:hypothetical protein
VNGSEAQGTEAQAVAVELNAAAGRERPVRYREKWAIARQIMRAYWGWDKFITLGSDGSLS